MIQTFLPFSRYRKKVYTSSAFRYILQSSEQQGYQGLNVLTDAVSGEGLIVSYWETEADAEASEAAPSYIAQMSMMSSFLRERLTPRTYQASVRA